MPHPSPGEPALLFDEDPQAYADLLATLHSARRNGRRLPARPRPIIQHSWNRVQRMGLPVDHRDPDVDERTVEAEHDALKEAHRAGASQLEKLFHTVLAGSIDGSGLVGVLTTRDARVLDRCGDSSALARADRIGFVHGARWLESSVGTNAIGIAARLGRPVQVHGPEHWCLDQHGWSCAASPVRDPATGAPIAMLDVSGPVREAHAAILALVRSLAAQVELTLRASHVENLERLRSRAMPLIQGITGMWVLCDRNGWVAGSNIDLGVDRVSLPDDSSSEVVLVPRLGTCRLQRADDVVLITHGARSTRHFSFSPSERRLDVHLDGTTSAYTLSARHADIVHALLDSSSPITGVELASAVWGEAPISQVTVRAELSRLRRRFPGLISAAPYRLLAPVEVV